MTGKRLTNFVKKIKSFSWKNVQGKVTENYDDLSEPDREFYPQIKTGFKLFKGDYVPQNGFSAHCQPKGGDYIDLERCMEMIQEDQNKPCVIIGQPGSGKTILMKRLAKTFMITNQLHGLEKIGLWDKLVQRFQKESQEYDIVFHFNIRDMPNLIDGTLAEVIFNPAVTELTKKEAKFGLQAILKKKIQVIMFFDGLDQATWEPECDRKIGPWETASTGMIFGNILTGHLLSHVRIVISSREHSVALLSKAMRPDFVAALVGFSEADAKSLYCELMGSGAAQDWDKMHLSNPAMHSMCLTPLFLIFYMITKKRNPEDPPDCATGVMVSIIQIFLECENARNLDDSLLGNLKQMAFQGTKEQRVVFTSKDLEKFHLAYKDISDIIIQVPGLAILGHKILEGMYRFFFSHQTLQEILAALHVVGMERKDFEKVVDEEFPKPYWSIVRSFTCGILKNEQVKCNISDMILAQDPEDFARKCEHLIKHLQAQLGSSRSPADKLETFIALKEANDLDLLQGLAENLDFSNSTLTPPVINILCSVMKYIGEIPRLSLANSNLDDVLLKLLANEANTLEIKIGELDMRGNIVCRDYYTWRRLFESFVISTLLIDIPFDTLCNNESVKRIIEIAEGNVENIIIDQPAKLRLNIKLLEKLSDYKIGIKFKQISLVPKKDEINVWRETFSRMPITVDHCFVENPKQVKGRVDVNVWKYAIVAAGVDNVNQISLMVADRIALSIDDLVLMNALKFSEEMPCLSLDLDRTVFDVDVWQRAFQQMQISVDQCFIVPRQTENEFDVRMWIEAAGAADVENVKNISLKSSEIISLKLDDLMLFNETKFTGKVLQLRIIVGANPNDVDNFYQTMQKMKLTADRFLIAPPRSSEGVIDARAWVAMEEYVRNRLMAEVELDSTEEIVLNVNDIESLSRCGFDRMFAHLWMEPNRQTFDPITWRQIFLDLTFNVDGCFIKPPLLETGKVDVELWVDAAQTATCDNVRMVSMATTQEIALTYSDIECLMTAKVLCLVNRLRLKAEVESFLPALWRQTFQRAMLHVNHCMLEPPRITKGNIDIRVWSMAAAIIANIGKVARVSLVSTEDKAICITDLEIFGQSTADVEISELWIKPDHRNPNCLRTWKNELKDMPLLVRPIMERTKTGQAFILKPRVLIHTPHNRESGENLRDPTDVYVPSKSRSQHPESSALPEPHRTDTLGQTEFSILRQRLTRHTQRDILRWQRPQPTNPITESLSIPTELHMQIEKMVPRKDQTGKPSAETESDKHVHLSVGHCYVKLPRPDKHEINTQDWIEKGHLVLTKLRTRVTLKTSERITVTLHDIESLNNCNLPVEVSEICIVPKGASHATLLWQELFEHLKFTVDSCHIYPLSQETVDVQDWIEKAKVIKAANVRSVTLKSSNRLLLKIDDVVTLSDSGLDVQIDELRIKPDAETFDAETWRQCFERLTFTIGHCAIEPPQGVMNTKLWLDAVEAVRVRNTKVSLCSRDDCVFDINSIIHLNEWATDQEIHELCIKPDSDAFDPDTWRRVFSNMSFMIKHCIIEAPKPLKGVAGVKVWVEAAKIVRMRSSRNEMMSPEYSCLRKVQLYSSEDNPLSIHDVKAMSESKSLPLVTKLWIEPDVETFDKEIWEETFMQLSFNINQCYILSPIADERKEIDLKIWVTAVKAVQASRVKRTLLAQKKLLNHVEEVELSTNDFQTLTELGVEFKISRLRLKEESDIRSSWRVSLTGMGIDVTECLILPIRSHKGKIKMDRWVAAARILKTKNDCVKILLTASKNNALNISDVRQLNGEQAHFQISELWIEPTEYMAESWENVFAQFKFRVGYCYVILPHSDKDDLDAEEWIQKAKAASCLSVDNVSLISIERIRLTVDNIKAMSYSKVHVETPQISVKPNLPTFDEDEWRKAFQEMSFTVDSCLVEAPDLIEGKCDMKVWMNAANAAQVDKVKDISLKSSNEIRVDLSDIILLSESSLPGEIHRLCIQLGTKSFDCDTLRQHFKKMKVTANHCVIEPPRTDEDKIDFKRWKSALEAARIKNFGEVTLCSTENHPFDITNYQHLQEMATEPKTIVLLVRELHIKIESNSFDEWQIVFQKKTFVVDHCLIELPPFSEVEGLALNLWIEVVESTASKVSVYSTEDNPLTIHDVVTLSKCERVKEVLKFWIEPDAEGFDSSVWRETFQRINFNVGTCFVKFPISKEGVFDFEVGLEAAKAANVPHVKKIILVPTDSVWAMKETALDLGDIMFLTASNFCGKLAKVQTKLPNPFDENLWSDAFRSMSFTVNHCYIEPLLPKKSGTDVMEWIRAAQAISTEHIKQILLRSTDKVVLSAYDLKLITNSNLEVKMSELWMKPNPRKPDSVAFWRKLFENVTLSVDRCYVQPPHPVKEAIDVNEWVEKANAADVTNVGQVALKSTKGILVAVDDIKTVNNCDITVEIQQLRIQLDSDLVDDLHKTVQGMKLSIDEYSLTFLRSSEGIIDMTTWTTVANALRTSTMKQVLLDSTADAPFSIDDIVNLNETGIECKISQLWIQPCLATFDPITWRQVFDYMTCNVDHCFVKPPMLDTGDIDVELWQDAADVCDCENVAKISFGTTDEIELDIYNIDNLTESKYQIDCLINQLRLKLNEESFAADIWQEIFLRPQLHISHCLIESPLTSKGEINCCTWRTAAEVISCGNVDKVTLCFVDGAALNIDDFSYLNDSLADFGILDLWVVPRSRNLDDPVAWKAAMESTRFNIARCFVKPPKSLNRPVDVTKWIEMANAVTLPNMHNVTLKSTETILLDMDGIAVLSTCNIPVEIPQISIRPEPQTFDEDAWKETFRGMSFTVDGCRVDKGKCDVDVWLKAAKTAIVDNVKNVSLVCKGAIQVNISEIMLIIDSSLPGEIGKLRVKFDSELYNEDIWRQAFQQMSFNVDKFLIEAPYTSAEEHAVKAWIDAAEIVREAKPINKQEHSSWRRPWLSCTKDNPLFLIDIVNMNKFHLNLEMETLWIIPDAKTYSWTEWYHAFNSISFHIENCIVMPPSPIEGDKDREVWLSAATSARRANKSKVSNVLMKPIKSFYPVEKLNLTVSGIEILTQSKFYGEIHEARYKPTKNTAWTLDSGWEKAFKSMLFTVRHLLVKHPTSMKEYLKTSDVRLWIKAADGINVEKIKKVSLMSATEISMNEECIALLSTCVLQGNIATVELKSDELTWIREKSSLDWSRLGAMARKFRSSFTFQCDPPNSCDLKQFMRVHGNIKIGRVILSSGGSHRLIVADSKKSSHEAEDYRKEVVLIVHAGFLHTDARAVGRLIRDAGFVHVTIGLSDLKVNDFTSDLAGCQIQTLAVRASAYRDDITKIVSRCNIEKLYLVDDVNKEIVKEAQEHCKVTILSTAEWDDMFAKIERQGPTGPLTESIFGR